MTKRIKNKREMFVAAYQGSIKETCKIIGCTTQYGYDLLQDPDVMAEIQGRWDVMKQDKIASREELQSFWTNIMRNPEANFMEQMKASELLGKSNCEFTERKIIEAGPTLLSGQKSIEIEDRIKLLTEDATEVITIDVDAEETGEDWL